MLRILAITVGLLIGSSVQAERIENFVLLDQHGDAHNLHYHQDKSAVVIMIQGNGCPIVRNALTCLLYTSPSPRDEQSSRMPSSA